MIYIALLILSFTLTYLIKNYAIKKSLVATVNERSSHTVPTPHGGGIAIAITWFIGLIYLYINNEIDTNLFYSLMIGLGIAILSFIDDIVELSAKFRMVSHFLFATFGLWLLGGLSVIDFGLFSISNEYLLSSIIGVVAIVYFINVSNFMDGLNGFLSSEMVFLSVAGFILFGGNHFIVLGVSILGFLYWNFGNKARIFIGDSGSTLLGYNIAIFTIYYTNIDSINLWIWIILFGLFWFDATLTILMRKLNGEQITQAHKKHAYQRLQQSGWSHLKVSLFGMGINMVLFMVVYFISNIAIAFICSLIVLYGMMRFIDKQKAFK